MRFPYGSDSSIILIVSTLRQPPYFVNSSTKTLADRFYRHSQAVKMVIIFYKAWQNAVPTAQYAQAVNLRRTQLSDLAF